MPLLSDGYGVPNIPLMTAQSYDMSSICSVAVTLKSQWDARRDEGTDTGRREGRMDKQTGGQLTCHLSQRDKDRKIALKLIKQKEGQNRNMTSGTWII